MNKVSRWTKPLRSLEFDGAAFEDLAWWGLSLREQAHLARIGGRRFWRGGALQIVVAGIEFPYQLVELEGGFPDIEEQVAAQAARLDTALPVDGGIVTLMPGATALELPGSDLQTHLL